MILVPLIVGSPITNSFSKPKVRILASELLSTAILVPQKLTSISKTATLTLIFIDNFPSFIAPETSKSHLPGNKVTEPVPAKVQPFPSLTALIPSNSISPNSPMPGYVNFFNCIFIWLSPVFEM